MGIVRPTREEWLVALGCGLWAAAFLATERPALYVVPPIVAAGVLAVRRTPVPAALAVAAALLLASLLGVPPESPATLAADLVALYAVGRHAPPQHGAMVLLVFLTVVMFADEFSAATGVFALFLLGGTWVFGLLVRRRTGAARRAREDVARLASEDPALITARVVAEERSRLAVDTVAVIRSAVEDMRRDAVRAESALVPMNIKAIQDRGGAAVSELRRLLGLLRTEPATEPPAASASVPRRPWRLDLLTAAAVVALGIGDVMVVPGSSRAPLSIALAIALYAALALRRTRPAAACLAATVPMSLSVVLQTPTTAGYAEAVTFVLLAWAAATRGEKSSWAALAALAGVSLLGTWIDAADSVLVVAALFILPAVAGHAWSEHEREQRAAEHRSVQLQVALDAEVARAVTAERLRIARELHDVASHAVGVMVLQAGAAQALRERSTDEARAALRAVQSAGDQALAELSGLLGVLDAGALGAAGVAQTDSESFEAALAALAARIRATGVHVDLQVDALPHDRAVAATAFRVVQEALTNAARHAPGCRVRVQISRTGAELDITVHDDGSAASEPAGSGFGLVGLAERVRLLGGELSAGARQDGGYAVVARLPEARTAGQAAS